MEALLTRLHALESQLESSNSSATRTSTIIRDTSAETGAGDDDLEFAFRGRLVELEKQLTDGIHSQSELNVTNQVPI